MADSPYRVDHRRNGAPAAIVLIHGFGGNAAATWGHFPDLLKKEPQLKNWDIFSLGYSTSLTFDLAGVWSADPEIITLGGLIQTVTEVAPLDRYGSLAILAHSMGGLLVQRALLSDAALRARVSHLLLFGTPSAGLERASPFQFWKRQVRDMSRDSAFIRTLRQDWGTSFREAPPFSFFAIAGDRDEFVPRTSSLDPFTEPSRRVVYGNHLEIVKPENPDHLGFTVAVKALVGVDAGAGLLDAALRAVESRQFQHAINTLGPHADELDDNGLVTLALALESVGRQRDAIDLLKRAQPKGTNPLGVLAGRLKRRWLVELRRKDAEQALALYRDGLAQAEASGDVSQAYYHAINCAFMELAFGGSTKTCRDYAARALAHCANATAGVWRYGTEGEANLYLGNHAAVREAYAHALALSPSPRQIASMYQQAFRAADLMGEETLGTELRGLFGQRSEAAPA
jgi:pimeloyl-ACP methyl ester carboxylesterase